jgi:cyd operon protein YbgT
LDDVVFFLGSGLSFACTFATLNAMWLESLGADDHC